MSELNPQGLSFLDGDFGQAAVKKPLCTQISPECATHYKASGTHQINYLGALHLVGGGCYFSCL